MPVTAGVSRRASPWARTAKRRRGATTSSVQIFRNMRLTMKVSRETIARRLATSAACVDSFEVGRRQRAAARQGDGADRARLLSSSCASIRSPFSGASATTCRHWRARREPPCRGRRLRLPCRPPPGGPRPARGQRGQSRAHEGRAPRRRRGARTLFALSAPVALARRPGLSGARGAEADVSCHRPAAGPGRDCRACRHGLSGAPARRLVARG